MGEPGCSHQVFEIESGCVQCIRHIVVSKHDDSFMWWPDAGSCNNAVLTARASWLGMLKSVRFSKFAGYIFIRTRMQPSACLKSEVCVYRIAVSKDGDSFIW